MVRPQQLALNIRLRDEATFDNFWREKTSANAPLLAALQALGRAGEGESFIYIWGRSGAGRSHLLQAVCHRAQQGGWHSQYLPLRELASQAPASLLEGLEQLDILCLDDLPSVLGDAAWEEALFHLYNRIRQRRSHLLVAADCSPRELDCQLADLRSRLAWGVTYRLEALDDQGKCQALQWRARQRGMELGDEVAQFILHHHSRDPAVLFACLDQLDRLSLAEQRRLTIPFVRAALSP